MSVTYRCSSLGDAAADFRRTVTRCHLLVLIPTLVLLTMTTSSAHAGSLANLLKTITKNVAKSSDETVQRSVRLLDELATHSDDLLRQTGTGLHPGASSVDEVLESLARSGIEVTEDVRLAIAGLDDAARGALVGLLEESSQVLQRCAKVGLSADDLVDSLRKGGPDLLLACRQMQTDDGLQAVVEGTRRFGGEFVAFARKGDEAAVRQVKAELPLLGHAWDDPKLKPLVDDLLANPTKYIDEAGKPTKAWDELLGGLRKSLRASEPSTHGRVGRGLTRFVTRGVTLLVHFVGSVWALTRSLGAVLVGLLTWLLPTAWHATAAFAVQLIVFLVLTFLVLLVVLPRLVWLVNRLLLLLLRLLSRGPGGLGRWANSAAEARRNKPAPTRYLPRHVKPDILRIGLLGVQRVGKTTFIVMLCKHLHRRVPGALLRPHREVPDSQILAEMESEVSQCRPTREDRQVTLDLTWPFFWEEADSPSPVADAAEAPPAGKLDMQLELADYPGEWAAEQTGRSRLQERLREVDGLFVVIDPTELEADSVEERLRRQEEAIEQMFRADRLDLGRSFCRSLGILITKRDALTPALLRRLAERRQVPCDEAFEQMVQLVRRPALTSEESQQLGRWLFELLFPGVFRTLQTRLAEAIQQKRSWCARLFGWFRLHSRPPVAVFAVSQLGTSLGRRVTEYRRQVQQWEAEGRSGPQPEIELDLNEVDSDELESSHAFRWMFNSIPEGWLHTVNQLRKDFFFWLPVVWRWLSPKGRQLRKLIRRFEGAPCVQRNQSILRKRAWWSYGLVFSMLLMVVFLGTLLKRRAEIDNLYDLFDQAVVLVDSSQEEARIAEHKEKISNWSRNTIATQYVRQADLCVQLLDSFQRMQLFRKQAEQPDIPFDEMCKAVASWLSQYLRLPIVSEGYSDRLKQVRATIARPCSDICLRFLDRTRREVTGRCDGGRYEEAYTLLEKAENAIPSAHELAHYRSEIDTIKQGVAKRHGRHIANQAMAQAQQSVERGDYRTAIEILKSVTFPDGLREDDESQLEKELQARKEKMAENWFQKTESQVGLALEAFEIERAAELLREFRETVNWSSWPGRVDELQKKLADRLVNQGAEKAQRMLAEGDPDRAKQLLERCRPFLPRAEKPTRQSWNRIYARALLIQENWRQLGEHLLTIPPELRESDWDEEKDSAWRRWKEQFDRHLQQPELKADDLSVELDWAKSYQHTMPPEVSEALPSFEQRLRQLRVEQALQAAEAAFMKRDYPETHTILDRLRADVAKDDRPEMIRRWYELKLRAFEATSDYFEAARWLEKLELNMRKQISDWEARHDRLVEQACAFVENNWPDRYGKDPQAAFQWLHDESHRPNAPEGYYDRLLPFAKSEVDSHLAETRQAVDKLLGEQSYEQAEAKLTEAQKQLGPWVTEPGVQRALGDLRSAVATAKVDQALERLEKAVAQPNANREQIHAELEKLLGPKLTDRQRARANRLMDVNLTRLEHEEFERIKKYHAYGNYDGLRTYLERYCNPKSPYRDSRPEQRRKAAENVRQWFEPFDRLSQYEITGIAYEGVPYSINPVNPRFDLAFRIKCGEQELPTAYFSVYGNGAIQLPEVVKVNWSKGQPLEIEVWDDEVGEKGHFIGRIKARGNYGLPWLALEPQSVDCSDGDYKSYNWTNFKLRLVIPQIQQLPSLP